jgi:hypothetical protein
VIRIRHGLSLPCFHHLNKLALHAAVGFLVGHPERLGECRRRDAQVLCGLSGAQDIEPDPV